MNDSEQTEGEHLAALARSELFPFRLLITFAATNAGWNMVVLLRCRLQYSLFRPILPSLHRPLGALGSNPLSGQANSFRLLLRKTHLPLYPAQRRTASKALSTSSSVLAKPSEKRTVPCGKVESVLCALGAQCRPQRVSMPNSVSRRKATSALS